MEEFGIFEVPLDAYAEAFLELDESECIPSRIGWGLWSRSSFEIAGPRLCVRESCVVRDFADDLTLPEGPRNLKLSHTGSVSGIFIILQAFLPCLASVVRVDSESPANS